MSSADDASLLSPMDTLAMTYLGRDQVHALIKTQLLFDAVSSNVENSSLGVADLLLGTSVVLGDVDGRPAVGLKARTITTVTCSSKPEVSVERDCQAAISCQAGPLLTRLLQCQLMPASIPDDPCARAMLHPCAAAEVVLHLSDGSSASLTSISPRRLCSDLTDDQLGVLCAEASWQQLMRQPSLHRDTDSICSALQRQALGLSCAAEADRVLSALAELREKQLLGVPAEGAKLPGITGGSLVSTLPSAQCTCLDQWHAAILDRLRAAVRSCEVARGKLPELLAQARGQLQALLPGPSAVGGSSEFELEMARRYLDMAEAEVRQVQEHGARKERKEREEGKCGTDAAPAVHAWGSADEGGRQGSRSERYTCRDDEATRERDAVADEYDERLVAMLWDRRPATGRMFIPAIREILPVPPVSLLFPFISQALL